MEMRSSNFRTGLLKQVKQEAALAGKSVTEKQWKSQTEVLTKTGVGIYNTTNK